MSMQVHYKMRDSNRKIKNASLHDQKMCMQMEMKANLNDNNAKQCKKRNLIYERK